uniref:Poxin n=1 Tax=Danaus plexippus TaxID=13037 RepID=UPI0018A7E2E1|nr:Chain A, Poxin [Danaus plexippus]6XB6_B Chain B, Poxin [Danaus plexippus]
SMMKSTALNEKYYGLVENVTIPASLHEYNGKPYSKVGNAMPIHCATQEEKELLSRTTHHYCDLFTDKLFAPLEELVFVRLDENKAEKVFLNRHKRLFLTSSDGVVASWRCAPTLESLNKFMAGTPLVGRDGRVVSLLTAKHGNHYAVSHLEGDGGYFETSKPWEIKDMEDGRLYYGNKSFNSRDELRAYIQNLPPLEVDSSAPPQPILLRGKNPRIILVAENGRQISHQYISSNLITDVEYL